MSEPGSSPGTDADHDEAIPPQDRENRLLLRAAGITGLSQVVIVILRVARSKVIAVTLGPEGVGVYSQIIAFVETAVVFALLGMGIGALRLIPQLRGKGDLDGIRRTIWGTLGLAFIVASAVAAIVAGFPSLAGELILADARYGVLVAVGAMSLPAHVAYRMFQTYFDGYREVRIRSGLDIANALFAVAFMVPLVLGWQLEGAVYAYTLAAYGLAVLAIGWFRRKHGVLLLRPSGRLFDRAIVSSVLSYGLLSLLMANSYRVVFLYLRRTIIADFGADVNGLVQAAQVVSGFSGMIVAAFHMSYSFARIGELESDARVNEETNRTFHLTLLLLAPVTAGIVLLRKPLLWLLFSADFIDAGPMLTLQALGDFCLNAGLALGLAVTHRASRLQWALLGFLQAGMFLCAYVIVRPLAHSLSINLAYAIASATYLAGNYFVIRRATGFRFSPAVSYSLWRAIALLATLAAVAFATTAYVQLTIGAVTVIGWLVTSTRDERALFAPIWEAACRRVRSMRR